MNKKVLLVPFPYYKNNNFYGFIPNFKYLMLYLKGWKIKKANPAKTGFALNSQEKGYISGLTELRRLQHPLRKQLRKGPKSQF